MNEYVCREPTGIRDGVRACGQAEQGHSQQEPRAESWTLTHPPGHLGWSVHPSAWGSILATLDPTDLPSPHPPSNPSQTLITISLQFGYSSHCVPPPTMRFLTRPTSVSEPLPGAGQNEFTAQCGQGFVGPSSERRGCPSGSGPSHPVQERPHVPQRGPGAAVLSASGPSQAVCPLSGGCSQWMTIFTGLYPNCRFMI